MWRKIIISSKTFKDRLVLAAVDEALVFQNEDHNQKWSIFTGQWRIQDLREGGAEVCAREARAHKLGHAHQFTRKFEVRRS